MERRAIAPRPGWTDIAESKGFIFHHVDGKTYWDESAFYAFSLAEIENQLEDPAAEIYAMCLELVADAMADEQILLRLKIPESFWDIARQSWLEGHPSLYGRFDFAYSGKGPAKLLEFNADTPTSLYESAYFQWNWLEDVFPHLDQFNSIQERLCDAFSPLCGTPVHFASVKGSAEDRATVEYLMDCALQAGVPAKYIYMEDIGVNRHGQFLDLENIPIRNLFKLYPWEYIWEDDYGRHVTANIKNGMRLIEPPWKMILSNKGILPLLWQRHKGHPNLLPAWFEGAPAITKDYAMKPILGREGANVAIYRDGRQINCAGGHYGKEGFIRQEYCPLPDFGGNYPVCGLWIANGVSCGLGIREDKSMITGDLSRFVPHVIEG